MHERVELENMQREGVLKNIPKDKVKTKYLWSVATSILFKKGTFFINFHKKYGCYF